MPSVATCGYYTDHSWPPSSLFFLPQLPAGKAHCSTTELQHVLMAMAWVTKPDNDMYFTDSLKEAGQALQPSPLLPCRLELVTIHLALEHTHHRQEATVVLHTDSMTRLQVLQQLHPSNNVELVIAILGSLKSVTTQGRQAGEAQLDTQPYGSSVEQGC
ncbi:hypothetical protein E2C01_053352 [Portunus trituberculatus]|uniref:RNase H type-1 domain-containing protein n=1 Tax=Portunus trituberculatus TaxID=210409 RepID=A0A5B7GRT8_PORTR|nr:hypothetical protein [Portunus trituberculatus]